MHRGCLSHWILIFWGFRVGSGLLNIRSCLCHHSLGLNHQKSRFNKSRKYRKVWVPAWNPLSWSWQLVWLNFAIIIVFCCCCCCCRCRRRRCCRCCRCCWCYGVMVLWCYDVMVLLCCYGAMVLWCWWCYGVIVLWCYGVGAGGVGVGGVMVLWLWLFLFFFHTSSVCFDDNTKRRRPTAADPEPNFHPMKPSTTECVSERGIDPQIVCFCFPSNRGT